MTKCFSPVLLLASIWTTRLLVQGSLQVQELSIMPCRIMGVTLVEKKTVLQLNFTEAQEACRLMGLTLASKDQVEAAWKSSFETCSYGWVSDQFLVISRILPNPKCGKNGVGVLVWRRPLNQNSRAYCHNSSDETMNAIAQNGGLVCPKSYSQLQSQDRNIRLLPTFFSPPFSPSTCITFGWGIGDSQDAYLTYLVASPCLSNGLAFYLPGLSASCQCYDIWINSCSPEIITTKDPIFDTQSATYTTEMDGSDNRHPALSAGVPHSPKTPPVLASTSPRKTKLICVTEVFMETTTISTETESHGEYTSRFKNEGVGFGGVPTALLVLALLFFAAAAGLGICYVKRYVKAFPFTNKNQQKEMIETKLVKEEKADNSNPNEEPNKTDKKPEEPKSPPKTTVRCLEAEV